MASREWAALLLEPEDVAAPGGYERWFTAIAERLLCGSRLMVNGVAHRLTEVEMYYHGGQHLDIFSHRESIQRATGAWYFHRTAGVYRGGSFKGVDLTFGGPDAFGGVLLRGLELEGELLLDGPSLLVDHLLRATGHANVAALDETIGGRPVWDRSSLLHLTWLPERADLPLFRSARVGLSLRRFREEGPPTQFLLRRYRYLTEPGRIRKGKLPMALALHAQGASVAQIRQTTGVTRIALERYISDFEEGKRELSFGPYFGVDLGPRQLARLHGLWWTRYGI